MKNLSDEISDALALLEAGRIIDAHGALKAAESHALASEQFARDTKASAPSGDSGYGPGNGPYPLARQEESR